MILLRHQTFLMASTLSEAWKIAIAKTAACLDQVYMHDVLFYSLSMQKVIIVHNSIHHCMGYWYCMCAVKWSYEWVLNRGPKDTSKQYQRRIMNLYFYIMLAQKHFPPNLMMSSWCHQMYINGKIHWGLVYDINIYSTDHQGKKSSTQKFLGNRTILNMKELQ